MYNRNEKAIIWLDIFDFLSYGKMQKILDCYSEPQELFDDFKNNYKFFEQFLSTQEFDSMCNALNEQFLESYIINLDRQNIKILTFVSEDYPKQFLDYYEYPHILYCKGDLSLLKTTGVAIVGSRKITRYGKVVTEQFSKELATSGITIVSGLADGVDAIAHKTTLDNGGKTIAVMGSGFNEIYPASNYALEKEIEAKGLVVTEYKPNIKPVAYHFPVRNRIIAGIAEAVLITEATIKSGALHTRDYCLDYGKDLFVVPGNIDNFSSGGCNLILKACQGSIVTEPNDILEKLNVKNKYVTEVKNLQLSFEEQLVLNALDGDTHFDELLQKTKLDTKTLISLLTTLELNGIIKKLAGNYYCK